jgi:hypothetical protein
MAEPEGTRGVAARSARSVRTYHSLTLAGVAGRGSRARARTVAGYGTCTCTMYGDIRCITRIAMIALR